MSVLEREEIRNEDLTGLFDNAIVAILIQNYCDATVSRRIAKRLTSSSLFGHYINAPEIGRVGQAFFESQADPEARSVYAAEAVPWIRAMRACCAPLQSPIDRLRLELDETWSAGAQLGTFRWQEDVRGSGAAVR